MPAHLLDQPFQIAQRTCRTRRPGHRHPGNQRTAFGGDTGVGQARLHRVEHFVERPMPGRVDLDPLPAGHVERDEPRVGGLVAVQIDHQSALGAGSLLACLPCKLPENAATH